MNTLQIADWEPDLLSIIKDAADGVANPKTVADVLDDVAYAISAGILFSDLPAGFDHISYAESVLRSSGARGSASATHIGLC